MKRALVRPTAALGLLLLLLLLSLGTPAAVADDPLCTPPDRNALTTSCFGACDSAAGFPLCVSYAPPSAQATSSEAGQGDYYYLGCAFTEMDSCKTNVTAGGCELQCLQRNNADARAWVLDVAQPQEDRADTALFQHVSALSLPPTLQNLTIAGATGSARSVPLTFSKAAFLSGTALERISILDVTVKNITVNMFPPSLETLIVQRSKLERFDPRGNRTFTSVRHLDLSENELTDIPLIIYELSKLSTLKLQGNYISGAHVTNAQWQFLESLPVFEANLTVNGSCSAGYVEKSWAYKSVCVLASDGLSDIGSGSEDSSASASSGLKGSSVLLIALLLSALAVVAAIGGVILLRKRVKRKAETASQQHDSLSESGNKLKSSMRNLLAGRFGSSGHKLTATAIDESYYEQGGSGDVLRLTTLRDIPPDHVTVLSFVAKNGDVDVSKAEYLTRLVTLHQLTLADDVGQNSESAHLMVPTLSQLRHPQLLSLMGLVWDDAHTISAVCEHMNLGTLEAFLHSSGPQLTWQNFKMKAACQIARGLMYLHGQCEVTYDGLNGRSVFVDTDKGCKLNPVLAAIPPELEPRESILGPAPDSRRPLRRFDSSVKAFFAPEVLAGEAPRAPADMYAFGVLLAHLDTCESADEMIRSSWRLRTTQVDASDAAETLLEADTCRGSSVRSSSRRGLAALGGAVLSAGALASRDLDSSRRETARMDELRSTSLMTMFTFTDECPEVVRELATACLQFDPSLRPSASYIAAMLHF